MAKIDTLCEVRVQNVFQIFASGLVYVQTTPRNVLLAMEFRSKIYFFVSVKLEMKKSDFCVCSRGQNRPSRTFREKRYSALPAGCELAPLGRFTMASTNSLALFIFFGLSCRKFQIGGSAPTPPRGLIKSIF